jgi:hypothetical protein
MPKSRNVANTGVILVGIGVLCELAAYWEQPDLVQFSPNHFYTTADLRELEAADQALYELQTGKDLMNQSNRSDDQQGSPQVAQVEASNHSDRATRLAAAESKLAALQQKQDRAFRNQAIVSEMLKWVGVAVLIGAAIFLAWTGRTTPATLVDAPSDNRPSY